MVQFVYRNFVVAISQLHQGTTFLIKAHHLLSIPAADMPLMITAGPSMAGIAPPGMVPPGVIPGGATAFPPQQAGFYGQY